MPFPVDERFIVEAEAALGVRLPDAYRTKLQRENGGDLSTQPDVWMLYPVFDKSERKRLKRTCNHVVLETQNARGWRGFPPHAVAIGDNGSGDVLVLLPLDERPTHLGPSLFWWDHETGRLNRISNDISELL